MYILNLVEIRWKLRILWRKFKKERFDPKIEFEVEIQNSASIRSPACCSRCILENSMLLRLQTSEINADIHTNIHHALQTVGQCPLYSPFHINLVDEISTSFLHLSVFFSQIWNISITQKVLTTHKKLNMYNNQKWHFLNYLCNYICY